MINDGCNSTITNFEDITIFDFEFIIDKLVKFIYLVNFDCE